MKKHTTLVLRHFLRSVVVLFIMAGFYTPGSYAQSDTPTPVIGEFLAGQSQLLLQMEGVIQKVADASSQNDFRQARLAVQQAHLIYRDSLDLPLTEAHSITFKDLKRIETKVREVWMNQIHYKPLRIAPEYETAPAFQTKETGAYSSDEGIPPLTHQQIRRLKAHTRTNFLVGAAFGSSLVVILSFVSGMLR